MSCEKVLKKVFGSYSYIDKNYPFKDFTRPITAITAQKYGIDTV
jgi:hypothetical protein